MDCELRERGVVSFVCVFTPAGFSSFCIYTFTLNKGGMGRLPLALPKIHLSESSVKERGGMFTLEQNLWCYLTWQVRNHPYLCDNLLVLNVFRHCMFRSSRFGLT